MRFKALKTLRISQKQLRNSCEGYFPFILDQAARRVMEAHNLKVAVIAKKVLSFFDRNEPFRISHGSTNSTRPRHDEKVVDISTLSSIVEIDVEARTVLVEPNVPMDKLVAATLERGLVPPVVVEFPGITAGGAFSGTAGESSSFKFGLFDKTVNRVEILLGNSNLVNASREENS